MGLREVTFDRQDPSTRELLRRIGLDERQIDRGAIREDDSTIRFELVQDLASVEEMRVDDYLSLEEARHHLRSLNAFETQYPGFSVAGLFRKGFCPTDETPLRKSLGDKSDEEVVTHSALTLSRNLFWRFTLPIDVQNAEGVLPLAQCPFNPILPADLLRNVHFSTRSSPPEVDRVARAVGRVTLKNRQVAMQASAVAISPRGHIVTAYHALFHEGHFLTKVQLQFGERIFEVHREHILAAYPEEDLVLLQIPGADLPFLEIASDPPGEEETVWLIGFPGIKGKEPAEDPPQQAFSVARVAAIGEELLAFDPGVPTGYSGGAIVDRRGRLIGIISFKFLYDMWTFSPRMDSRRGEMIERISGKKPPDDAPYLRLENRLVLMTGSSLGKDPDAVFVMALTPLQLGWNRGRHTREVKLALDGVIKRGASEGFVTRARIGLGHNRLPRIGYEGGVYAGYDNRLNDLVLGAVAGLFLNRFSWGTPGLYIDYGESLGMGDNPATRILAAGLSYQYNH